MQKLQAELGTRTAQGMSQGNGATIKVDQLWVQIQLSHDRQGLGGKSFV